MSQKNTSTTPTSIKSFILGFLLYFIAVVVADIYGGSGITNVYYVVVLLLCFNVIPLCFKKHIVPIELLIYFVIIIVVEYINRQRAVYYFEGLLQLISLVLLSTYLSNDQRMRCFAYGVASSITIGCIYFCLFATNSELNFGDSELRHSLPFFYISSAGLMTALGYFLALVNYFEKKKLTWLSLSILCFLTCLYTLSKNALLAMFFITIMYLMIIKVIQFKLRTIVTAVVILLLIALFSGNALAPIFQLYSEAIDTSSNDDMISISGRGGIWLFCVESIPDHLWFGHGYYSASELLMFEIKENVSQAHNGMLHALLSTGWFGWTLLTIYLIRVGIFVKSKINIILSNTYMKWILCMLLYFMIRSITEASFAQCGSLDVFWFFSLSLIMIVFVKKNKIKNNQIKSISC